MKPTRTLAPQSTVRNAPTLYRPRHGPAKKSTGPRNAPSWLDYIGIPGRPRTDLWLVLTKDRADRYRVRYIVDDKRVAKALVKLLGDNADYFDLLPATPKTISKAALGFPRGKGPRSAAEVTERIINRRTADKAALRVYRPNVAEAERRVLEAQLEGKVKVWDRIPARLQGLAQRKKQKTLEKAGQSRLFNGGSYAERKKTTKRRRKPTRADDRRRDRAKKAAKQKTPYRVEHCDGKVRSKHRTVKAARAKATKGDRIRNLLTGRWLKRKK